MLDSEGKKMQTNETSIRLIIEAAEISRPDHNFPKLKSLVCIV